MSDPSTSVKTYVTTTGVIFALLVVAHVWRGVEEGRQVAGDPWFILTTVISAALSAWAWRVLGRTSRW
ncbi:MAG: hypothetical protein ABIR58_05920 [Gemmatimonadaceae bacterium]